MEFFYMDFGSSVRQSSAHRSLCSRPCFGGANGGFTLVELMVVVAIVAIFAVIAAPSFTSLMHRNAVSAAANEFYDLLQYSRGEAVTRNNAVTISAPGSSNSAWNGDISVAAAGVTAPLRKIGTTGLQPNVIITTTVGSLLFSATGNSSAAACFAFTYTNDNKIPTQYIGVLGSGRVTVPSTTAPTTGECP
jgi:type IV fimbrial biogenesis protein FimU